MRRLITSDQVMPFVASRLHCSLASSCARTAVGVSGVGERSYDREVLYGRDSERAEIGALLDEARSSHSGALVISGEPGVGKTALLTDARERAVDMCVLDARGVESESELAFAGLHQLFRPWLAVIEELPGAQAKALRGALGLADPGGDDRFLISAACLTLLSELARTSTGPLPGG